MKSLQSWTSFLLVVAVLLVADATAFAGSGWTVVPSRNPSTTNYLYGVAAISKSDVWATGYEVQGATTLTLAERWNGADWSVVPSPNPGTAAKCGNGYSGNNLSGAAAISSTNVWTVGWICGYASQTLTEHWNGARWTVVPSPNQSGAETSSLVAVAGLAFNNVWAVGNYQVSGQYQWNTLIEHWDGRMWSIVSSPNIAGADKNFLNAVAAVSPTDIWAVGYSEGSAGGAVDVPLIEHYDGNSWSIVQSAYAKGSQYNALYSVTAISTDDVWAVGYENENTQGQNGSALAEHWDGSQWTLTSSPVAGLATSLYGIAANSRSDVWAVGYIYTQSFQFLPVSEHWDGSAWTVVTPPNRGKASQLLAAAAANGEVWAVGAFSNSTVKAGYLQNPLTLTMRR